VDEVFGQFLGALAKTERMPLPALAHYQEGLLKRLVAHARETLPFYRARLDCLVNAAGEIDLSRWNDVPILSRADVIAAGDAMQVKELPREYGEIRALRTSGSSGVPLVLASNGMVAFAGNAHLTRMARWFGLDTAKPMATIRRFTNEPVAPYPEGNVGRGWSFADADAPLYELELMSPVEEQLEWLARRKPAYLVTQASGALALGQAVTPAQGRALGIEVIFLIAETIPEGTADFLFERLGARSAGIYSCQEIGAIACECSAAPHYHVCAENALVEIVDEKGRDVAPGARGRVLVTGFYNYAMPFIRYDLGDIATAGDGPCPCGRTLPVVTRIEGRTRNAFLFEDGKRLWPRAAMVRAMRDFVPFRRYQLVQLDRRNIEFRYVPDDSGRMPDLDGLADCARRVFHPSVSVSLCAMDALPAGTGGKVEEFISLLPEAGSLRV